MSSNLPTVFSFNDTHKVRVVDLNGDPWFVAADVCRCLDMNTTKGVFNWLIKLDSTEKQIATRANSPNLFRGVHAPSLTVISESGLYKLIMRSDKPEARAFQDWVTKVVLPAIRKDGAYVMGEEKLAAGELSEDEFVLKAMTILQNKVERITVERDRAIERAEVAEAELNNVTVDEWRALNHLYLPHGDRTRLGKLASSLAEMRGVKIEKQHRTIATKAGVRDTFINVYPKALLDEVAKRVLPGVFLH